MEPTAQARDEAIPAAREYGTALGEHIIAVFGERIPNDKVDEAVALVTAEIFRRIDEMSAASMARPNRGAADLRPIKSRAQICSKRAV